MKDICFITWLTRRGILCCCLPPLEAALRMLAAPVLALVNLVLFVVAVSVIDDQLCKFLPSFSSAFCMQICEPGAPCCYELHCCTKSQVCISPLALPVHSACKFVKLLLLVGCHELHWCPKSAFPHLLFLCILHANLWIWCSLFLAMNFINVKSAFPHLLFFLCILHANLWIWFFLLRWTSLMSNSFNSLLAFPCAFCMQIWKSAAAAFLLLSTTLWVPISHFLLGVFLWTSSSAFGSTTYKQRADY